MQFTMECHRRCVLFVIFLLQICILILYSAFQHSDGIKFFHQNIWNKNVCLMNKSDANAFWNNCSDLFIMRGKNHSFSSKTSEPRITSKSVITITNNTGTNKKRNSHNSKGHNPQNIGLKPEGRTENTAFTWTSFKNVSGQPHKSNVTRLVEQNHHYLICPDPLGRLGNLMFEFAASVGIAATLKYKHVINSTHPLVQYFEITQVVDTKVENVLAISEGMWRNKKWREEKKYVSHNLTLNGFFQAWTYFNNVSDDLRRMFTIRSKYLKQPTEFLRNSTPKVKTLIGIHVRRGDFLTDIAVNAGRVVANRKFLNKSMNFFRQKYRDAFFVVMSNDIKWCKDNIQGDDVTFSHFTEAITDMAIMSLCNHSIITAGSYSWWGGWLSGGTVVYLNDFPKPGSSLDRFSIVRREYYFPYWIPMTNG